MRRFPCGLRLTASQIDDLVSLATAPAMLGAEGERKPDPAGLAVAQAHVAGLRWGRSYCAPQGSVRFRGKLLHCRRGAQS